MLKRVKSVSMLLFLMAASTGSMNAVSAPAIASSNAIEQQTETCIRRSYRSHLFPELWVKQSSVRP